MTTILTAWTCLMLTLVLVLEIAARRTPRWDADHPKNKGRTT